MDWMIREEGFDRSKDTINGNKFLTGNGYCGIRGTLQEFEKEEFPAINLAGIYDQVGNAWREPLNAPNALFTYVEFNGISYRLPQDAPLNHKLKLDYRHGIFCRETTWKTPDGEISIIAERFASLICPHLIVMKYSVKSTGDGVLKIITGIDGDVWDINGPHYDEMQLSVEDKIGKAIGITHENKDRVCVCEAYHSEADVTEQTITDGRKLLRVLSIDAKANETYSICKWISVFTSKDTPAFLSEAIDLLRHAMTQGYEAVIHMHKEEWEKKWNISEVIIEGDDEAMEALNYSIYHLHCIAPRHTDQLSIAARGLSGQTYKGAVFWDTEMFILDLFLFTEPAVAKTLLKYRIDTLEGALNKAGSYGYEGAFYAWESQEGGYDACSDYNVTDVFTGRPMRTFFKDKQIHISSAVAYGIMRYVNYTGDYDLLAEGGAEVIIECAKFYYDLLLKKVNSDRYELHDVIGPDEYHERVNNNAYTNRMAKYTFVCATQVLNLLNEIEKDAKERIEKKYDVADLLEQYQNAADKLYIPQPDDKSGIIEQFDGYMELEEVSLQELKGRMLHEKEYWGGAYGIASHTKVIKQADVVTMLNLFSEEYDRELLLKNWEYYEPRTEHGSSLSACMYAMLACKCGMPDQAYPFFLKSATSDLSGKGKEWAGLIYIGGTHPASSGGAYMTAIEGFAGVHQEDGILKAEPGLPANWNRLCCKVIFRGDIYQIEVTKTEAKVDKLGKAASYPCI